MSYGVAVNTRLVGVADGDFLDDLTNPNVGEWPKDLAIRRIAKIVVHAGYIVDGVTITYELTNDKTVTVQHGGTGGGERLNLTLTANQKVIAVYGRRLNEGVASDYGDKNIVQLSFIIATNGSGTQGAVTVATQTVTAVWVNKSNSEFDFTWPLVGVTSYTGAPSGAKDTYLQAFGFSEVFATADAPF